ncbi:MAG: cellulose biosynthesis protein BcsG [Patescibacteria group bacterium]
MNYKVSGFKLMFWSLYFLLVFSLHLLGIIAAHAFFNLFLIIFIFFPISERLKKIRLWELIKNSVAIILAIVLLWHESYLPSFSVLWNFLTVNSLQPSSAFVWHFILSIFNFKLIAFFLSLLLFSYLISFTRLRKYSSIFFIIFFFVVGFTEVKSLKDNLLGNFYSDEAKKNISLINNPESEYDIVILQLCSFSWDDFDYASLDMKPFFKQFDFVFTNFNSAATYSNPAVLRLLRSTCGQVSEGNLFAEANKECYLIDSLRNIGYSTYTSINHDGYYSGFRDAILKYGHADTPLDNSQLKAKENSFDNTPVYSDKEALNLWSVTREKDNNKKSALFYNSITLHTGGYYVDGEYLPSVDQYNLALNNLTSDLDSFFSDIKKSNRRTIVIVIGEHGAALRGSAVQTATVREIPLPSITQVPVAIKIFGPGFNESSEIKTSYINERVSYLALSELLKRLLLINPLDSANLNQASLLNNLPKTDLVSENQTGTILQNNGGLFYKLNNNKTWDRLSDSLQVKSSSYLFK